MDKVSVIIETRLEACGDVETDVVAVVPVFEEDQWLECLDDGDGAVLEAFEVDAADAELEDGERVYVLCAMIGAGDEILSALYVTNDEEEAAERAEELSEERQEEVRVIEASFCSEGDE